MSNLFVRFFHLGPRNRSFGHNSNMDNHNPHNAPISKRCAETLEALEDLIVTEGFSRLNVSEIAARLRCSKRTLYELAPSKKTLVLVALDRFFSRIRKEADHIVNSTSDPELLVYKYLMVGEQASKRLSQAVVADIDGWEPARTLWRKHITLRVDGLFQIIDKGVETGVFREVSPAFIAEVVFASINRLREPDFGDSTGLTISEAFHELYVMTLHSLIPNEAVTVQADSSRIIRIPSIQS